MENLPTTIKPIHIGVAVGVIVAVMIAIPIVSNAFNTGYPPVGSKERYMVDACVKESPTFNRLSSEQVQICIAFKQVTGRY